MREKNVREWSRSRVRGYFREIAGEESGVRVGGDVGKRKYRVCGMIEEEC